MSKILAIHACRRGIGRSHLAGCLAAALAQQGQRVALIETSEPGGNAADLLRLFGLSRDYPARALAAQPPEEVPWDEAIADVSYLLGLVAPPETTGALYLLRSQAALNRDAALLHANLQHLSQAYRLDCILLALSSGLQPTSLAPLALSDLVLLVLGLDRRDFQEIAVTLDIVRRLNVPQIHLAVSAVPPALETERWREQVELAYAVPAVSLLPHAPEIALLNGQELLYFRQPQTPYSVAVQALARQLQTAVQRGRYQPPIAMSPPIGLGLLDLLDLPNPQRHLLNWAIRHHRIDRREAIALLAENPADPEAVRAATTAIDDLLARGILRAETEEDRCYYRPAIAPRQRRQVAANIWQALEQ